jgi:hypothetical protein
MASLIELDNMKMPDGTVIAIFQDGDGYVVAQFDKSDIQMWEETFEDSNVAWAEYHRRIEHDAG